MHVATITPEDFVSGDWRRPGGRVLPAALTGAEAAAAASPTASLLRRLGPRAMFRTGTPVADAVRRLKDRYSKASPAESVDRLAERYVRVNILSLYRELFPKEFAESKASYEPKGDRVDYYSPFGYAVGSRPPHSDREWEFFQLVNKHLFDLPLDYLDMTEQRLDEIMFDGPFSNWEEHSPDGFSAVYQLAGAFITNCEWTLPQRTLDLLLGRIEPDWDLDDNYGGASDDYESADTSLHPVPVPDHQRRAFWAAWESLVKPLDPPLRHMDDAVNVMSHSTGVFEIDVNCMCGTCGAELPWTRENIEMLAEQHRRGQKLFDGIRELNDWLVEDPEPRVGEVVTLYNYAAYLAGVIERTRVEPDRQLSLFHNTD